METVSHDLNSYFDVLSPEDIRLRGTRVGIESVLIEYLHRSRSPEQIAEMFRTVTLEQVYATILLYLSRRDELDIYLQGHLDYVREARDVYEANLPDEILRLRRIKRKQVAAAS